MTECCTGILRRAKAKNRKIPEQLKYALMIQGGMASEFNTENINDIILVMGSQQANAGIDDKICQTITATAGTGGNQPIVLNTKTKEVFENHSQDLRFKGPLENSPTITVGGNNAPFVSNIDKTYTIIANILNKKIKNSKNGLGLKENEMVTITTNDIHAVYNKKHYKSNIGCLRSNFLFRTNKLQGDFRGTNQQYVGQGKCILSTVELKNREKINLVRRITPLECERLQGFPDNFTNIENCTDSARYKALGNSVAIPCVEYYN